MLSTPAELETPPLSKLRRQALAQQWQVADALGWNYRALAQVPKPVRRSMTNIYSDTAYAEAFGVGVIERLVALAPEGSHRDFARFQLADETRHAALFAEVVAALGDESELASFLPELQRLLLNVNDYHELMLHAHVVETTGRLVMIANVQHCRRALAQGLRLPGRAAVSSLLHTVATRVATDESRHIAFGRHTLDHWASSARSDQRHALEDRASVSSRLMYRAFAHRAADFARFGMDAAALLQRLWSTLSAELARFELDIGSAPSCDADSGAPPL